MYVFWMIMIVLFAMLAGPIKEIMERQKERAKEESASFIIKLQDEENTKILIKDVRIDTSQGLRNKFEIKMERSIDPRKDKIWYDPIESD